MAEEPSKYRVVTPEQLQEGWLEKEGMIVRERKFTVIEMRDDGNYIVYNPEWLRWTSDNRKG